MSSRVTMLLSFALETLVVFCAPLDGAEQDVATSTFPHMAYVVKRVCLARSGPGMSHYPTDVLPEGEQVQVVEKQEAWLAIRSPADSFSWVPGDQLRIDKDGKTAEVSRDNVTAWIGSNIEVVDKHRSQVKLRKGERVVVLGQRDVAAEGERPRIWVKIEPPTGEHRWILAEDVDTKPPAERPVERGTVATDSRGDEDRSLSGWTDRTSGVSRRGRAEPVVADSGRSSTGGRQTSDPAGRDVTSSTSTVPTRNGATGSWTSLLQFPIGASFDDRLARVQLALSRAAASGGTAAQMDLVEQRARELIESGQSAYERGQATLLLESVREFRKLARRRRATVQRASYAGPMADGPIGSGLKRGADPAKPQGLLESITAEMRAIADAAGTLDSAPASASGNSTGSSGTSPYLAEGWLMPVSSPTRAAPPFVLMDDEGHPVAFVTPAPGVNLRRYVDKQVGIMGQSAFGVLNRQHVVAHRAIELARHRDSAVPPRTASPWIRTREADAAGARR